MNRLSNLRTTAAVDLANLDMLRSAAVLMVFSCHILEEVAKVHRGFLFCMGQLGVRLFFIHTSYVLMLSIDRLSSRNATPFVAFYVRRIFRLYPLSILTIVIVLACHVPPTHLPGSNFIFPSWRDIASNLLLIQNLTDGYSILASLWTLPYEVQMYILLPLIFVLMRKHKVLANYVTLMAIGVGLTLIEHPLASHFSFHEKLLFAPWFFMGIAAFSRSAATPRIPSWAFPLTLLLLSCCWFFMIFIVKVDADHSLLMWAGGFGFAWVLPLCRQITSRWVTLPVKYIARYSYGIYLAHMPILWFAFQDHSSWPFMSKVALTIALVSSIPPILYHLIENPCIRIGAQIAESLHKSIYSATVPRTGNI